MLNELKDLAQKKSKAEKVVRDFTKKKEEERIRKSVPSDKLEEFFEPVTKAIQTQQLPQAMQGPQVPQPLQALQGPQVPQALQGPQELQEVQGPIVLAQAPAEPLDEGTG